MAGDRVYPHSAPPAGAYYNVKDQHLPPPATYRGHRRGRSPCCCLFKCLCSILAVILVLLGIAVLIIWLVVQPRIPKYDVENVRVSGLNAVTGSSTVNTNLKFDLEMRNPNKKVGIYYDSMKLYVATNGVKLGEGDLPSFYQGHKNTTIINADMDFSVPADSNAVAILASQNDSNVPLDVDVDVRARVKVGSWKSRRFTIKVRCDLNVDLTKATGSQIIDRRCKVKR